MNTSNTTMTRLLVIASYLLVAIAALLPRITDLGSFITHDESEFWLDRSAQFLRALQRGDYGATAITTHPGVTTMWLGSSGILMRRSLFEWGIVTRDSFPFFLTWMRIPVAVTHTLVILVGYALLRRLLWPYAAFLAACFWALDPFLIGYSRLLHVDALAASFATLSLLAACHAFFHSPHHTMSLVLSGSSAALAFLSKSPALALLPIIGALALFSVLEQPGRSQRVTLLRSWLIWIAATVVTLLFVWPALWANPSEVVRLLRIGVANEGAQPHMTGNFFLGQRTDTPDWRFYPVALALRTTPWGLLGLFLLPWAIRAPAMSPHTRHTLATMAAFILLFILIMSIFPKKFNRYLILIFPLVTILSAVGWAWASMRLAQLRHAHSSHRIAALVQPIMLSVLIILSALNVAAWHPYTLVAFNQLLGGAPAGARTFPIGWGEGMEQVAAWLNEQPDSTGVLTISRMIRVVHPYLNKGVHIAFPEQGRLREHAGYVVVSVGEVQGGLPMPPFDTFYQHAVPLHTVTIHGVPYAWIYQVPPTVAHQHTASFGEGLHLLGYTHTPPNGTTAPHHLSLVWEVRHPLAHDLWLFVHLVDENNQTIVQVDVPFPTTTWQPGRFMTTDIPIAVPPDTPSGSFSIVIGWYDVESGARLHTGDADALFLTSLDHQPSK